MIELRNQTVENIINAADIMQVDQKIDDCIKTLKNNNTHDFIIIRFLSKLEVSLKEGQGSAIKNTEIENLKEAIRYINKHDLNKVKLDI